MIGGFVTVGKVLCFIMRYTQTWKKKCYLFLRDIVSLSHRQDECVAVIHLANAHDVWIPTCTLACFTAILSRAIYRFRSCMGFPPCMAGYPCGKSSNPYLCTRRHGGLKRSRGISQQAREISRRFQGFVALPFRDVFHPTLSHVSSARLYRKLKKHERVI
jgi:hypothetical protein